MSHNTCCHTKEVGGVTYHHIDDHDLVVPATCKSHCVYQKHGEEGKHYCFGKGDLETKCIEPGGGECGANDDGNESFITGTPGKYIHSIYALRYHFS